MEETAAKIRGKNAWNTFFSRKADLNLYRGPEWGMTTNLGLFLLGLQELTPISIQSAKIDFFSTELPISNQETEQSYNFKGISSGSSDENIFFTADGVKFQGQNFPTGEKMKITFSLFNEKSMSASYDSK